MEQAYIKRKNKKLLIFTSLGIITSLATLVPLFISCKNNTNKDKNDFEEQIKPNNYEQDFKLFYSELRKHLTQDYGFEWDDKNNKIKIVIEPAKNPSHNNTNDIIQRQISRALANSPFIKKDIGNYNSTFYSINIVLNRENYIIEKEVGFNVVVNKIFSEFSETTFLKWIKDNDKDFKTMLNDEKDKNNIVTIIKSYFFEYLKKLKSPSINIDVEKKIKLFDFQIQNTVINFKYELITNDGSIDIQDISLTI